MPQLWNVFAGCRVMADVKRHRRLTSQENHFHNINEEGCLYISYVLRISSSRVITEEDGRKVFTSLYRKTPNLRLCVADRDGELWFRQMPKEKIDFQVIEGADVNKIFHEITSYILNDVEGPMWAARLLPWAPSQDFFVESTSCNGEEESKHPNVCHVVVVYRHVITDGYSCMRIARSILTMFNDLIAGNDINETTQIGSLLNVEWKKKEKEKIEQAFLNNPQLPLERKKSYASRALETLFEKAYPVPPKLKPRTATLQHIVDKDQTKKFLARCKAESVTVHTAFCALINVAIIRMLLDAGLDQPSYTISGHHAVDNRVYYGGADEFGLGIGILDVTQTVAKEDAINNFWDSARKYHAKFKDQHRRKAGLENEVIEKLTNFSAAVLLDKDGQDAPSKDMAYYSTTNMRDITFLLGDCGDHVYLEFLDRRTTMHLMPTVWMNAFNTLRGRFLHSLQYNAHLMTAETAEQFSKILFDLFSTVSSSSS